MNRPPTHVEVYTQYVYLYPDSNPTSDTSRRRAYHDNLDLNNQQYYCELALFLPKFILCGAMMVGWYQNYIAIFAHECKEFDSSSYVCVVVISILTKKFSEYAVKTKDLRLATT